MSRSLSASLHVLLHVNLLGLLTLETIHVEFAGTSELLSVDINWHRVKTL